jgi:hypothetical protein
MALILLEGLDRTGKSTIAKKFEEEGYEIIHLSAPGKQYTEPGYTGPSYLDDMIDLIQQAANKDIVLDRTHYGELIWPQIYNRPPLLTNEDIEIIREMEDAVGVRRILMHDTDHEAHCKRCVDNNEPLTRPQFMRARTMYDRLGTKYGFEKLNIVEMPWYEPKEEEITPKLEDKSNITKINAATAQVQNKRSKEQTKLEKANAINDILSKRIVKGKTPIYDEIEKEVRDFLNKKLGTILGSEDKDALTQEEVFIIKTFVKRLKEKDSK